ncbi:transporter [Burkholderiaceae bacterium UC74_6]
MSGLADGSDHLLICGFVLRPGEAGRAVDLAGAESWIAGVRAPGEFLWLHINLSDAKAQRWLQDHQTGLELAPEFFDTLQQGSRSTRIEDAADKLIAVVNDVAYEFSFDPSDIATLWMNVSARVVVSARLHPLRSIDRLRSNVREGLPMASTAELLTRLLQDQADVLARIVREATLPIDSVEDRLLGGKLQEKRAELARMRRVLVRLQRLLAPEPGSLFRLLRQPPPWMTALDRDELRQASEEFSLVLRDMASLEERIKLLQEEVAAQVSEQTNRSLFTLTIVTVLALPINIVAGLLGMNVGGIPLAQEPHGFAVIVALVIAFTALAAWWAFRKRD